MAVVAFTVVAAAAVPVSAAAPLASPILQSRHVCVGAQVFSTSSPSTVSSTSGEGLKTLQCMINACMHLLSRSRGRAQYLRQSLQKQLCIHVGPGRCDAGCYIDRHAGLSVLIVRVSSCLSDLTSMSVTILWHVSKRVHGRVVAYIPMLVWLHNHCRGQASERSAQFLISRSVALCLQLHTPSRS